MKLTAKTTAALPLPVGKSDVIHFDEQLPGFGLRLRRGSGGKVLRSWVCQYRRAGQTRRVLLGSAEVLGTEQARLQAKKVLGAVAMGQDPSADRADRRDKDRNSLRTLVDEFLAAKQARLRPRSLTEVTRYLCGPYFKPLHGMPLDTIARRDVAARVVAIARESGSPTAARARGALSSFFAWVMTMGLCEHNPTIGSAKPAESTPRARVLSDAELVAIWKATGDGMEHSKIVRLLILSACRRSEIGDLRWTEIAPDLSSFTIPAARSKNGRAHRLPLLSMAREIIESVPRMAMRDQLFGQRSHGFTRWVQDKRALDERSGVVNWMVHDIRRSVATKMADIGVQPHIIEAVLNHYSGHRAGVAGTYNRSPYANEMRNALAVWHDHLRTIIGGGERKVLAYPQAAT
jgi:integrase